MVAVAKQALSSRTTGAILEKTAAVPLHLWPNGDILTAQAVSSKSLWGDPRWVFDNKTHGATESASTIRWDLDLPDGHNLLDTVHADLLDWLRRLIWSLYAAPGDGAVHIKPGGAGSISSGLRYWICWLVEHEIVWPHQIDTSVVDAYREHLQASASDNGDTQALTESTARVRLMPFALLWRQRFALEAAGIAPMPATPFGRAGVYKIAKQIAAVAMGSYRPLPDEVAIPVLNTAMRMMGTPAADVIALAEECTSAYASELSGTLSLDMRQRRASRRQFQAAKAFRFGKIDGERWHAPLAPDTWEPAMIAEAERRLQHYLDEQRATWQIGLGDVPTLPICRSIGRQVVDVRKVTLDLGLKAGDEQLLYRHPILHSLLDAVALEQSLISVPFINEVQRVRQLVLAIRSAALVVVQATTGMRISEICGLQAGTDPVTGLPLSIHVRESLNGLTEIFVLTSELSKTEDTPRAVPWVVGYRPKGSTYLPPAVQAIAILERLLAPWREMLGTNDLLVHFRTKICLPKNRKGVSRILSQHLRHGLREFIADWVDLTSLPDEAAKRTMDKELVPYRQSHGRNVNTHQLRKSFGYFAANIDRRLVPMLQMNFHHVSAAMTDGAYTGNPILERDLNDVRYQNLALESLEIARGNSGMAGRYGAKLEKKITVELGSRISGLSTQEAYLEAFVYVEEAGIDRLFFEPYGICGALSASEMECHKVGGTSEIARWEPNLTPNYEIRHPSLCAGCASFAMARRHLPYWEMRYIDNKTQVETFKALNRRGPFVSRTIDLSKAQAEQAHKICLKLGSDIDELDRRVAVAVKEAISAPQKS